MKTIKKITLMIATLIIFTVSTKAQGWIQDKKGMYSVGLGATQVVFLPPQYYPLNNWGSGGLSINVAGEYRVHRLLGLGWQTGVDFFLRGYYYSRRDAILYNAAVIGIPIGMKFNFHILEATQAPIKSNLDVYAGINLGGGPAFFTGPAGGAYGFLYGGPQVGVRYWFDSKVAIFGELGWGATIANIGVTF